MAVMIVHIVVGVDVRIVAAAIISVVAAVTADVQDGVIMWDGGTSIAMLNGSNGSNSSCNNSCCRCGSDGNRGNVVSAVGICFDGM